MCNSEERRDRLPERREIDDCEQTREVHGGEPAPPGPDGNPEERRGQIEQSRHRNDGTLGGQSAGDDEVADQELGDPEQAPEDEERGHRIESGRAGWREALDGWTGRITARSAHC